MNPIYVPSSRFEDWQWLLARPDQWKQGYSAYELAHAWSRQDWPHEVVHALHAAGPALAGLEMLLALPEHKVPLPPPGDRASQTDLMVIARNLGGGLVVIAVEGKVRESFGPLVSEWREDGSEGRRDRLLALRRMLGLDDDEGLGRLRYQLLHRTASALIEAHRFSAQHAVLLVHSFSPDDDGHEDFALFAKALDCVPVPQVGEVRRGRSVVGPDLWLGWARGQSSL